jgi:hypothetical protein
MPDEAEKNLKRLSDALSDLADKVAIHPVTIVGHSSVAIASGNSKGSVIGTYASAHGNSGGVNIGLFASASTGDLAAGAAATENQKAIEAELRAYSELLKSGPVKKSLLRSLLERAVALPKFAVLVLPVIKLVDDLSEWLS